MVLHVVPQAAHGAMGFGGGTVTAIEILRAGRELLSDPARCTKGAYARTAQGKDVDPGSPYATCWCSHGAFSKVSGKSVYSENPGREFLAKAFGGKPEVLKEHWITEGHDASDHPTILRAWDRAIELAEAKQ